MTAHKETLEKYLRSTWVAQSVKHLTLAQVMISQFTSSSPASGFVRTAHSLEPASDSVSPFYLTLPPKKIKTFKQTNKQTSMPISDLLSQIFHSYYQGSSGNHTT